MSLCFTDISQGAAWRSTFLQSNPWVVKPPYADLIGFELAMVMPDLLHVFNLGVCRDVIGCVLKTVIKEQYVFPGSDIDERFRSATSSLRSYARTHGHVLRLKKITKSKIQWASKKYPEFKGSGSDSHITSVWLEETLQPFAARYGDLCTLLWSSNRAMRLLYSANRFLNQEERRTVKVLGTLFIQTYMRKASESVLQHELMYRVRPKTHVLDHILECKWARNPSNYSTWMDEDWLKKLSKTMQLCSSKTAQHRILERWLLAIPLNLKRILGSQNETDLANWVQKTAHWRPPGSSSHGRAGNP